MQRPTFFFLPFFFDVFKCCRITARCLYGHCASGGVRKVADSCKRLSSFHCKTQRAAAASALTGAQRKGLVPMGAFKGFCSSRVLTPEAAGSARVPSIPLQVCAGVWRSCWQQQISVYKSLDANHLPSVYFHARLRTDEHTLTKKKAVAFTATLRAYRLFVHLPSYQESKLIISLNMQMLLLSAGRSLIYCWQEGRPEKAHLQKSRQKGKVLLPSLNPESPKKQGWDWWEKKVNKRDAVKRKSRLISPAPFISNVPRLGLWCVVFVRQ